MNTFTSMAIALLAAAMIGGCAQPSMTAEQWDRDVVGAATPVLVEFYRPGCPSCNMLRPRLKSLMADYEGRIAFFQINTDTTWPLTKAKGVSKLPAVLLFVNGREIKRWVAVLTVKPYRIALDECLSQH